jgi:hypothetical protein
MIIANAIKLLYPTEKNTSFVEYPQLVDSFSIFVTILSFEYFHSSQFITPSQLETILVGDICLKHFSFVQQSSFFLKKV